MFDLEESLADAVSHENFELAMKCRDEICRLQSGAYVDVLQATMGFYKAFDNQSITDIARVYAQDQNVTCKHPVGRKVPAHPRTLRAKPYLLTIPHGLTMAFRVCAMPLPTLRRVFRADRWLLGGMWLQPTLQFFPS